MKKHKNADASFLFVILTYNRIEVLNMIMKYKEITPNIDASCFIADNATIIGDVTLEEGASVWFQSVIRGDKDHIQVGKMSNVQDHCTLHTDPNHILIIGKYVTIGHHAILHGATIEDSCLIGMGAIVLNGAHIGKHCIIGAGALVKEYQVIPENSVVVGNPAKIIKQISKEQIAHIEENAHHYQALSQEYKTMQNS